MMTPSSTDIRRYVLATAGHVDHGKSALVRALTGTDPDRLPEEKARGITIDLGFAHFALPSPAGVVPAGQYHVGVVDVPGHEDFVRNMVAGVGSVDAVLLVVAADDGWMPQTEEHLQILSYLDVKTGVVALTKADLASDEGAAVAAVRERLRGTPLERAAIVPTSVTTGVGLERLREEIARALSAAVPAADIGKPRLPVDRVFTLKGIGTVVTGTLTGGSIARGQSVVVQPGAGRARVRSVHVHNREVESAAPGSRVALNLPDLAPFNERGSRPAGGVRRGDVVTIEPLGGPGTNLYAVLTRSARAVRVGERPPGLAHGARVRVHHGATDVAARVRFVDVSIGELVVGGSVLVHLALEEPVMAFVGDRFVVRDWTQRHTLAGGIVLDADAPARPRRSCIGHLGPRAGAPRDAAVLLATEMPRVRVAGRGTLLAKSCVGGDAVTAAVEAARAAGAVVVVGEWVVEAGLWKDVLSAAAAAVDGHHAAHPEQSGLPLAALHAAMDLRLRRVPPDGAAALREAVVESMCRDGFCRALGAIRRATHRPALPPRLAAAGEELRRRLAECRLDAATRTDLGRTDAAQQALRFLIASGEAVELPGDLVLSADAYGGAVEEVRRHLRARGPSTVSQLKTALSSSRRVVVPLLERMDRDGVTRRTGDLRALREPG